MDIHDTTRAALYADAVLTYLHTNPTLTPEIIAFIDPDGCLLKSDMSVPDCIQAIEELQPCVIAIESLESKIEKGKWLSIVGNLLASYVVFKTFRTPSSRVMKPAFGAVIASSVAIGGFLAADYIMKRRITRYDVVVTWNSYVSETIDTLHKLYAIHVDSPRDSGIPGKIEALKHLDDENLRHFQKIHGETIQDHARECGIAIADVHSGWTEDRRESQLKFLHDLSKNVIALNQANPPETDIETVHKMHDAVQSKKYTTAELAPFLHFFNERRVVSEKLVKRLEKVCRAMTHVGDTLMPKDPHGE